MSIRGAGVAILPKIGVIGGEGKFAEMIWIEKVFGSMISFGPEQLSKASHRLFKSPHSFSF
jgi:hypothetical protein